MKIVQLGTNNGNDHVRDLCKSYNPALVVLVEPFSRHNNEIEENYKDIENVYIVNKAVVAEKTEKATLYFTELDGKVRGPECSYLVTSIMKSHLNRHGYEDENIETFTADAITISELFDMFNLTEINYLFIDIEGIDFDVLKTIDFNKYKIKCIQIEHLHLDKKELDTFMRERNYKAYPGFDYSGFDVLYVQD